MNDLAASVRGLDLRIASHLKVKKNREAIIQTYVLNRYALINLGCGMILQQREIGHLVGTFFNEIAASDPRAARALILDLRARLISAYPFWIPNLFHHAIELHDAGKAHKDRALELFNRALPLVYDMVIDSDHYAQLWIDARHNPLSSTEPWPITNQMPWFLVHRMLLTFKDSLPKGVKIEDIVEQLKLK